jgi:hypothetical protein
VIVWLCDILLHALAFDDEGVRARRAFDPSGLIVGERSF